MDKNNILKVAVSIATGRVDKYSAAETAEGMRAALIELNGGSDKINFKTFRRGHAVFDLVEELIPVIIDNGIRTDNPLFRLVDYKNVALGDTNRFVVEGQNELIVSSLSAGIKDPRRQRLMGRTAVEIETAIRSVKCFEYLNRILTGAADFNTLINAITTAFNKHITDDTYAAIEALGESTLGMNSNFVEGGTFDADKVAALIERVEARANKNAIIVGTKAALKNLNIDPATMSESAKEDIYKTGFFGLFEGTPCLRVRQSVDRDGNFLFNNKKLWILAGDDKPIKLVNEGVGTIYESAPAVNADLSQTYTYIQAYGLGAIAAMPIGVVTLA